MSIFLLEFGFGCKPINSLPQSPWIGGKSELITPTAVKVDWSHQYHGLELEVILVSLSKVFFYYTVQLRYSHNARTFTLMNELNMKQVRGVLVLQLHASSACLATSMAPWLPLATRASKIKWAGSNPNGKWTASTDILGVLTLMWLR